MSPQRGPCEMEQRTCCTSEGVAPLRIKSLNGCKGPGRLLDIPACFGLTAGRATWRDTLQLRTWLPPSTLKFGRATEGQAGLN